MNSSIRLANTINEARRLEATAWRDADRRRQAMDRSPVPGRLRDLIARALRPARPTSSPDVARLA